MSTVRIINADVRAGLATLADESAHCCVTSPPYWGLRDYGVKGQLGLEPTPEEYVGNMVEVFRDVRRVLLDDGTLWLNMGDCYAQQGGPGWQGKNGQRADRRFTASRETAPMRAVARHPPDGLKPKDLVGMSWRIAFALQADGWWLRSDIVWHKPNPMPESVTDRPTKAHEYVFLMAKSERYYYDYDGVREPCSSGPSDVKKMKVGTQRSVGSPDGRNMRDVWTIATASYHGAHFATFPEELARRCIAAGCPEGGTVLDLFGGAGTVGLVAAKMGRDAVLIELNAEYVRLARDRIDGKVGLMTAVHA